MKQFQDYIHVSRYARFLEDENRRETWPETVSRYITFFKNHENMVGRDIPWDELEHAILDHEIMPSMRALMTAGKALDKDNVALYNCLRGDTLVTTKEYGIIPIEKLSNKTVHIVDGDGNWTKSKCRSYGKQEIHEITIPISGQGDDFVIGCTSNHDWILRETAEIKKTSELQIGDRLMNVLCPRRPDVNVNSDDYIQGSRVKSINNTGKSAEVFCFDVPTTHSFLLTRNILTGNCAFAAVDTQRVFDEAMYILMCFDPDTKIKTSNGSKKISELEYEDEILTYDFDNERYTYTKPSNIIETPSANAEKIEIEFADGTTVRCTSDHKFFTTNRGWVKAIDLNNTDDIQNYHEINIHTTQ